jgi:hypothetical protein
MHVVTRMQQNGVPCTKATGIAAHPDLSCNFSQLRLEAIKRQIENMIKAHAGR